MDNQNFSQSMVTPAPAPIPTAQLAPSKKESGSIVTTIVIIVVSLIAATFIGLFVWMYVQWDDVKTDVDGQIDEAVAIAINENTAKLEAEFEEKEKYPYSSFSGPEDYGELSFEYPRTWSLYVAQDATSGGEYKAYLNPGGVQPTNSTNVNALRVTISTQKFDSYITTYESRVKSGTMTMKIVSVNGENANYYEGDLGSNNMRGVVAIMKIRDKTVVLQTDSMLFKDDFDKILASVKYNS